MLKHLLHIATMLKFNSWSNLNTKNSHLNIQHLKKLSLASYEHTQIMIPTFTFREKQILCSQYDPEVQPPKKNHLGIETFTICSQPNYLKNWGKKNYLQLTLLFLNFYLLHQFKIPKNTIYALLRLGSMLCNYLKQNQNPKKLFLVISKALKIWWFSWENQ